MYVAQEVFSRHQEMNQSNHTPSNHTNSTEHQMMLSLGSDINVTMKCYTARITGDNGQTTTSIYHVGREGEVYTIPLCVRAWLIPNIE